MTAPSQNTWDAPKQAVEIEGTELTESSSASKSADELASPAPLNSTLSSEVAFPKPIFRKGLSIGTKATVLAGIFGVLPVLAVGILSYRSADSSITERIAQHEIIEADQLSDQLQQFLQERRANITTMADIVSDSGLLDTVTPAADEADVDSRDRGDESDEDTTETELEETIARELTGLIENYRTYSQIAVLDLQGDVVVQSEGSARAPNQKDFPYFQTVLETEQPVVSEPVLSEPNDPNSERVIYVAAPILDLNGSGIQGVLSAEVPVGFIGSAVLLKAVDSEEGHTFRLVDSEGKIFQSLPIVADDNPIGQPIADILPTFPDINAEKQITAWIEDSPVEGDVLGAYAPMRGFATLDWSVVSSVDTDLVFLPQQQLLRTIVLGSAITGIISVLLGILLANRATQPVKNAAETVELIGQGKLHARMEVQGRDELAILGFNINQMAQQIQGLLQTLRQNAKQLGIQNNVLSELARDEGLIQGDAYEAAKAFTEAISTTLEVHRVSIWVYQPEEEQLHCLCSYDREDSMQPSPQPLPVAATPNYYALISENQNLIVDDVAKQDVTRELQTGGHLDTKTVSLLEVPIQSSGSYIGSVRCEHFDSVREWKPQEQTFVSSVSNLISLALESEVLQDEVSHLLDVVSEVEDGNLATQAQVSDRSTGLVADTFNRLIERLSDVLQQVVDTARQVSLEANQQRSQAASVAANAEQQAQEVSQVMQLAEEVEEAAQGSAQLVQMTNQSLLTVQNSVEQGQQAITSLTQGIGILQDGSDRIIQQMKTLGEFVGLADQFVQDQSQIASLTQTLALNASLVAARAAEQRDPRQFAVAAREFNSIATQVSQLAQQTNNSLTTLEDRSTQIHTVVSAIDADVQGLGGLVQGFTQGVEQTNQVFNEVQGSTVEAVSAGENISQSSTEIVKAAQSVAEVVRDITRIATESAESTQQFSQQADRIDSLSSQLLEKTEFFQLPTPVLNTDPVIDTPALEIYDAEATDTKTAINGGWSSTDENGSATPTDDADSDTAVAASVASDEVTALDSDATSNGSSSADELLTSDVQDIASSNSYSVH
ncbi:cache domain-containing protein [Oscillatoria sp. CS-180]|uniref:cache domain-containing protein n=1 Tax=Oscillatoria sp. CS-180 TaxID=3021720 RepID=UPI00232D1185|nr:cache domain-containing protein [Oscillatoria sp. CS-180]MDB9525282.1 cache domain-containing protein [Oscillatoria sp. CS-180]